MPTTLAIADLTDAQAAALIRELEHGAAGVLRIEQLEGEAVLDAGHLRLSDRVGDPVWAEHWRTRRRAQGCSELADRAIASLEPAALAKALDAVAAAAAGATSDKALAAAKGDFSLLTELAGAEGEAEWDGQAKLWYALHGFNRNRLAPLAKEYQANRNATAGRAAERLAKLAEVQDLLVTARRDIYEVMRGAMRDDQELGLAHALVALDTTVDALGDPIQRATAQDTEAAGGGAPLGAVGADHTRRVLRYLLSKDFGPGLRRKDLAGVVLESRSDWIVPPLEDDFLAHYQPTAEKFERLLADLTEAKR